MDVKKTTRNWIVALSLVFVFSFFMGFYINYRINEKPKSKLEIIQEIMENEWYYGLEDDDLKTTLETKMILGMLDMNKDPFTRYLTSLGALADSYKGIGISASLYGEYFIVDEVSSQNAIDDGIKKGDILIEINGVDLKYKTLEELTTLISNNTSDSITLKIIRDNNEMYIHTEVTNYDPVTVFTKNYTGIAYARISEFNLDTAFYLEQYFASLSSDKTKLVLDLRGNPGGYISSVVEVMDLFLGKGKTVMSTKDKHGNTEVYKTIDNDCYIFDKIIVLIDENSASGAEALSAALNYHLDDTVTLYGNTTYGKGSAQKTVTFSDGTYFHYTYALWNTPDGSTINKIGVAPEVERINTGISTLSFTGEEAELYYYGSNVYVVQKILKELNLYNGPMHWFMDEETVAALEMFQENNNLEVSGKLDNKTIRLMLKIMYDDKQSYLDNQLDEVLGSLSQ